MHDSAVRSKCQSSAGCIGYAYRSYDYSSMVYFNSVDAARSAATNRWRLNSAYPTCRSSCSISSSYYASGDYWYSCYRYNNGYNNHYASTTIGYNNRYNNHYGTTLTWYYPRTGGTSSLVGPVAIASVGLVVFCVITVVFYVFACREGSKPKMRRTAPAPTVDRMTTPVAVNVAGTANSAPMASNTESANTPVTIARPEP